MKLLKKHVSAALLTLPLLQSSLGGSYASAETAPVSMPSTVTPPAPPSSGYFIDHYKNNNSANKTESTNPAIGVLSGYNQLWTPGATWDTGIKLNSSVLDANI